VKLLVHRCDICGVDDRPENRVCVRVSHIPLEEAQPRTVESPMGLIKFMGFMGEAEVTLTVDLCERCGRGLLELLAEAERRRRSDQTAGARVSPGPTSTFTEIMHGHLTDGAPAPTPATAPDEGKP
jgi:hypothetical protein